MTTYNGWAEGTEVKNKITDQIVIIEMLFITSALVKYTDGKRENVQLSDLEQLGGKT